MIAYISGALVSAGENYIVIDNHGMGYRIFVSGKFLEHIPAYGTQIKIYTHMYIREDELTLYGFHSEEELSVFRILIGISGVGPKVAMAILTALIVPQEHAPDGEAVRPEDLRQRRQQEVLDPLHAHGQHLDGQQVVELVHRQARKGVRLPEDDPAGVQILRRHHALPVLPGPPELPLPEGPVKLVVGIAGHQPHPDLGVFR